MRVNILYNKNNKSFKNKIIELEKLTKEIECNKIEIRENLTARSKCDIYIIISDEKEEIIKFSSKIKNKNKLLVITSNIDVSHILACIDITKNVTYLNNNGSSILDKVNKIFYENSEI